LDTNRDRRKGSNSFALAPVSTPRGASLVLVIGGVSLNETLLVFGDVVEGENRIRGAGRNAGTAVDTLGRIDKKLGRRFETGLVLLGMDAIRGANVDAEGILNTGIGDHISHDEDSEMKVSVLVPLDCQCRDAERMRL
jgi:hypothetical protein